MRFLFIFVNAFLFAAHISDCALAVPAKSVDVLSTESDSPSESSSIVRNARGLNDSSEFDSRSDAFSIDSKKRNIVPDYSSGYRPIEKTEMLSGEEKYLYGNGFGFDGRYGPRRPIMSEDPDLFKDSLSMPKNIEYIKEGMQRRNASKTKEYMLYKKVLQARSMQRKNERLFYRSDLEFNVALGGGGLGFILHSESASHLPAPDSQYGGEFVSINPNLSGTLDVLIRVADKYFIELQGYYAFMIPYSAGAYIDNLHEVLHEKSFALNNGHRAEGRVLMGFNLGYFSDSKKSFMSILSGVDFGYYNHIGFYGDVLDYTSLGTTGSGFLATAKEYSSQMLDNFSATFALGVRFNFIPNENNRSFLDVIFNGGMGIFQSQSGTNLYLRDSPIGGSFGLTLRFQHFWKIRENFWISISLRDRLNFMFSITDLGPFGDSSIHTSFNYIVFNQMDIDLGFRFVF